MLGEKEGCEGAMVHGSYTAPAELTRLCDPNKQVGSIFDLSLLNFPVTLVFQCGFGFSSTFIIFTATYFQRAISHILKPITKEKKYCY